VRSAAGWRVSTRSFVAGSALLVAIALLVAPPAGAARYRSPPRGRAQWYWELDPPKAGLAGLPPTSAPYPHPGSADIWDTDLFEDAGAVRAQIPTGPSAVVAALHAAGKYSICYVDAGAYQTGWPDDPDFAPADYGDRARRYGMRGWPGEWWLNITGFRDYQPGRASTLTGAAVDIAAGLARRIHWCAIEGQDALEPDDTEGYANRGLTGVRGGGWHLTRADAAGFERWLAHKAHADGLAIFQKNDALDAATNAPTFDGMIVEQCNHFRDPCAGPHGDATPYLRLGKPVLDAEYTADGESRSSFCPSDRRAGISGALFNVGLNGAVYQPCAPAASAASAAAP
jgi:Glycoside-hydrolase family GH114